MNKQEIKILEDFLRYNIRHHILLAQYVSNVHKTKIYIFDKLNFFNDNNVNTELTNGIKTICKDGDKAVLNIAINEAFNNNQDFFLKYVDPGLVEKDHIGLFISPLIKEIEDDTTLEEDNNTVLPYIEEIN